MMNLKNSFNFLSLKSKIRRNNKSNLLKKGFTLIELVVVIAVIAIIAGVSVATYYAVNNSANKSATEQNLTEIQNVYSIYNIEQADKINELGKEEAAYNFISSYLPSQGITNRDTDLINYIVLKRKGINSDNETTVSLFNNISVIEDYKIVYVTTKPSFGYFLEEDVMSGDRLDNTKAFLKEQELIDAIKADERLENYDTSVLDVYGIQASKELQSYDLDNSGTIEEDEIGRKAIEVTFKYDNKEYTYYLKNGESIVDCDIRYLNGTGNTIFGTKGTLDNTITPFEPYGIIDDGNADTSDDVKLLFNEKINLTKDDIANATPVFKSAEEAEYLYKGGEYVGSLKQYEGNIFVNKSINLKDVDVDIPAANLLNYEACYSICGGSNRLFGDFEDCVNTIVEENSKAGYNGTDPYTYSSTLPDYDIYIGQKCVIDSEIILPKNVKVKVNYDVNRYGTSNIREKFDEFSQIKDKEFTPGHLIIKDGGKLVVTFEGNNRKGQLGEWAHSTDAGISVFSRFYNQRAGNPLTYTNAGLLTIEQGGELIISNRTWFRAFGQIDGDGKIIIEEEGKVIQHITTFDWMMNAYYPIYKYSNDFLGHYRGDLTEIFPTQKYTFNNIYCDIELKKNASYIGWIPMKFKQDYYVGDTRDIYLTFIGDTETNAEEAGTQSSGKISLKSLFGISNDEGQVLISREKKDNGYNPYSSDKDNYSELNNLRNRKIIYTFNCDVKMGNLQYGGFSIGDLDIQVYSIKDFWFPIYNSDYIFNGKTVLKNSERGLKIKVLPGSSVVIDDLSEFSCGSLVTYDRFNYFESDYTIDHTSEILEADMMNISSSAPAGFIQINNISNIDILSSSNNVNGALAGRFKIKQNFSENLGSIISKASRETSVTIEEIKNIKKLLFGLYLVGITDIGESKIGVAMVNCQDVSISGINIIE